MRLFAYLKKHSFRSASGQTLLEVVIALGIGSLLIGGAVLTILVMLQVGGISRSERAASLVGAELRRRLQGVADSSWRDVKSLAHGPGADHYLVASGTSFFAVPGKEGIVEYDLREDIAGHWGFDELFGSIAYDSASSRHDGTLSGGVLRESGCYVEGCLSFDGTDDSVDVDEGIGAGMGITDAVTVAAWVKFPVISAVDQCVVCWDENVGLSEFFLRKTAANEWEAGMSDGVTTETVKTLPALTPIPSVWYHVAFTRDSAGALSLYVNGAVRAYRSSSPNPFGSLGEMGIGAEPGGGMYLNGWIDDVRVYRRALGVEEIGDLYRGRIFSRAFYLEKVFRDAGGAIVSSAGIEDPASEKATVYVQWRERSALSSLSLPVYLTQWDNGVFVQSDWSRGIGPGGPFSDSAQGFVNSTNLDFTSPVGSLRLTGF